MEQNWYKKLEARKKQNLDLLPYKIKVKFSIQTWTNDDSQKFEKISKNLLDWKTLKYQDLYELYILIEKAWYKYKDIYIKIYSYKYLSFENFSIEINKYRNMYKTNINILKEVDEYRNERGKLPLSGAMIYNNEFTKILLVRNKGAKSWSFPKGKVEKQETKYEGAIREVYEETGINIKDYINETFFHKKKSKGVYVRLYIINVNESIDTSPDENEIEEIKWHYVDEKFRDKTNEDGSKKYNILVRQMSSLVISTSQIESNKLSMLLY